MSRQIRELEKEKRSLEREEQGLRDQLQQQETEELKSQVLVIMFVQSLHVRVGLGSK